MPGEQRLDRGNRGGDCSGDGSRQAFIELRRGRADGDPKRHRRAPIERACEMMNQRTLPCTPAPSRVTATLPGGTSTVASTNTARSTAARRSVSSGVS
jgi:hypothetical protein